MEVAGQWRRQWAGSAEVGKVYEGGGSRRVARAVEVLHASAAGTRVRVVRAAYHSAATRTRPAETFLMHSSRRVIMSNSRMMESPTFNSKPLEISSMPLELATEPLEPRAYHVTEPDDAEISEPSKWRGSTDATVKMPSDESSSVDNGSVIDCDTKMNISKHTSFLRKMSFDSDISDYKSPGQAARRSPARASPLLEPPAALSTLRYKSLLTGAGDSWHDRRKSYSFEDTSPLSESIHHKNETLAMESSTDSGICKSSELVNDYPDDKDHKDTFYEAQEGTFKDWLAKNRLNNQYKPHVKTHVVRLEDDTAEDRISLQSNGKVSITLPMNNQTDDKFQYSKTHFHSETDRRTKRVEFCKTELHFAADSGRVNIIATDEKPPPTNNFRKRRSAFVPMRGTFDKPITLFGEKISEINDTVEIEELPDSENGDNDENTAATKSILKNKIPKPKPYLLGENMEFGEESNESIDSKNKEYVIPTTVSMINRQLQPDEVKYDFGKTPSALIERCEAVASRIKPKDSARIEDKEEYFKRMTAERDSFREKFKRFNDTAIEPRNTVAVKEKLRTLQASPILQRKPKTRQLREHELTYFGIHNKDQNDPYQQKNRRLSTDEVLHSVELIKKVNSNSIGNSEAESDDTPQYQNLPLKSNFAPIPIPKVRTKFNEISYDDPPTDDRGVKVTIIKPVILQDSRRTRQKDTSPAFKSRSISEPPKHRRQWETDDDRDSAYDRNRENKRIAKRDTSNVMKNTAVEPSKRNSKMIEDSHIYANVNNPRETKEMHREQRKERVKTSSKSHEVSSNKPYSESIVVEPPCIKKRIEPLTNQVVSSEKHNNETKEADLPLDNKIIEHRTNNKKKIEHKDEAPTKSRKHQTANDRERHASAESTVDRKNEDRHRSRSSRRPSKDQSKQHAGLAASTDQTHNIERGNGLEDSANKKRSKRSESKEKVLADKTIKEKRTKKQTSETLNAIPQEKSNRKEYVINYDDKNGTVSSICKVKPGSIKNADIKPNVKSKSPERKKKSHRK